ncbi:homocysteine S-methyltransferase family protein [Neptunomonas marina]|uniref:Homocysteine S-methyltransferase family protein n=1 Tax=Neptunomonas marina TaxID=1815562 RepID=A0A437Q6F3_9GAMM|nr:homocysteine S-methyltransferase family protein [Neptunomonas marina]RVU30088.1 homocysteine S-methyltransferase family protein [Neptunomonas marina]
MSAVTILDGGMGRELERRGAPFQQPEWSALAMMEAPEVVTAVHTAFIEAGARLITTNSYALVPFHIGEQRFTTECAHLARAAVNAARQAADSSEHEVAVAGSIPPLFGSYRPDLFDANLAGTIARPLISALSDSVDLWINETVSSIEEGLFVKALVDELDKPPRPYWVSFTLEDSHPVDQPMLRSGEPVADAVIALANAGVDAILFNCCQPEVIADAIRTAATALKAIDKPIQLGAYANAFAPAPQALDANNDLNAMRADITPEAHLAWVREWQQLGATLIGGCCGIGPEHIAAIAKDQAAS